MVSYDDISSRKQAEEELRKGNGQVVYLRHVSMSWALCLTSDSGRYVAVFPCWRNKNVWTFPSMLGRTEQGCVYITAYRVTC